jgi:hypothetical protein
VTRRARRTGGLGLLSAREEDDPTAGVANLFDLGVVFALGFMIAALSSMHLAGAFEAGAKTTITTERKDGSLEVVVREGQRTVVRRLTKEVGAGDGTRLGTAYRLADGSVVYVPEGGEDAPSPATTAPR